MSKVEEAGFDVRDDSLRVEVGDGEAIFARVTGSGRPILLLQGFPETHLMWRDVEPLLAGNFTVVCADLPGYGASSCPPPGDDHVAYSKRNMATGMRDVMARLGFERFGVAGHDRGGRVAYRLALDHPDVVERLAVLDVVPILDVWEHADDRLTLAFWPWSLLAQPEPLPERLLGAGPDAIIDHAISSWGSEPDRFGPDIRAAYLAAAEQRRARPRHLRGVSGGGHHRSGP